jgi:hypothetical protein
VKPVGIEDVVADLLVTNDGTSSRITLRRITLVSSLAFSPSVSWQLRVACLPRPTNGDHSHR